MEKEEFDFKRFKEEAMRGLYAGKKYILNLGIELKPSATPFRVRTRGFQPLSTNPKTI
ncbi:MAG: hypothetical protein ACN6PI_14745 [Sphingobacterium siyangense]